MNLSFSIALCTWNGTAYLGEQLRSLAAQERLPDELVVRDDASSDDTVALVQRFAADAPFPVRLTVNPRNLGSTASFAAAIADCRGDLIALCDQDDSWLPAKLRLLERFCLDHPSLDAVFCDAWLADRDLRPTGERLWPKYPFGEAQKQLTRQGRFHELLVHCSIVHGMTLAFRRRLLEDGVALPFPDPLPTTLIHDSWLTLAAAFAGGVGYVDEPLVLYRQHRHQQLGARVRRVTVLDALRRHSGERRRLIGHSRVQAEATCQLLLERFPGEPGRLAPFVEKRRFLRVRDDLPRSLLRRVKPVLAEWRAGGYRRHAARPLASAVGDLFL